MSSAVDRLAARIGDLLGSEVELERPSDPAHGDFATNLALRRAKQAGRPPRELAAEYAAKVVELPEIESAEVAGPGFLNLRLADEFFVGALAELGEGYGGGFADPKERVQVEMVSANPTGPITVAAARNGAYGDCVARLLAFAGNEVEREYYYNDAGAQMERFRASVEAVRRGEPVPEDGYQGAYVAELAREPGDPVPRMLEQIERTLERFRIHFDGWARQSILERELPELLAGLPTYEHEGALFVRSTDYGDEKDRVLVRSSERGGLPTYEAADIAYLRDKLDRGYDRAIYILGADHHGVAGWYEVVARMLGYDPGRVEVLLYQLVHLTRGGEQTKMSKRRGDVVFLDDFMDEVGVDAARWYLVNRGPDQTIDIDLDLAAEKSQKNPVYYVQYAHARIAAILRNGEGRPAGGDPPGPLSAEEKELIKRLTDFPVTVREATERRGPQLIPAYAIRLADEFHRFYHECRVLDVPEEAFRLGLCRATQQVIARCLDLVGVDAPQRM
ncbi:MAG TPA: arginine--tRNA ligase [Gaiellaceae bacterium]|nr:arginine--tRNA ligase [Gaiellaceae bacterium]